MATKRLRKPGIVEIDLDTPEVKVEVKPSFLDGLTASTAELSGLIRMCSVCGNTVKFRYKKTAYKHCKCGSRIYQ